MGELAAELNRLAGTTNLDAQGAANVLNGTTQVELVKCMNTLAGTTNLALNGAVKAYAALRGGNPLLDANSALVGSTLGVELPTDIAWAARYKANLQAGADASAVTSATDQTVNARHAVQATADRQPTLRYNVLNGKKVYRFDGGDNVVSASWGLVQPLTLFIVGKQTSASPGNLCDGSNVAQNTMVVQVGDTDFLLYAGGFLTDGARNTNFNTIVAVFNGASSKLWVNGGAATTGNPSTGIPEGVCLGATSTLGAPMTGDIAEFAIVGSALSTADVNRIGAYVAYEYGLTWSTAS